MPSAATTTRHAVCVHECAYARARTYALTYSTHATGKFIDNVTLPGGREASHYRYTDPLGPISMADHDLYLDRATGTPVRVSASFHPFGVFVVRVRRRSNARPASLSRRASSSWMFNWGAGRDDEDEQ